MTPEEVSAFHELQSKSNGVCVERTTEPCGDYTQLLGSCSDESKFEGNRTMRANGCKRVRFEELEDGRMIVHGFLSE